MAKRTTKKVLSATKTTTPESLDLSKHSMEELVLWRNTASKRVDVARARMKKLEREYRLLGKKSHSDIKWIRRLHGELARKVFGHRPHDVPKYIAPKQLVSLATLSK